MTNNSELKKTKQSRFKLPSEIERWAYSNESTDEPSKINNENDDYEDIDDSYLQIYDDPNERKKVIDKNEQKKRVVEILNQVKSRKLARTADITTKKRNSFNSLISNIISANSNFDLTKQEQSLSMLKINDQTEEEEEDEHEKKSHKKKSRDESKKFRSISSGISRAVPGSLQQNITIERNFFKDLLKLSKQRYITKINADFQKKRFLIKQTNKGLYAEKESNNQIPRSHSSVVPRQSHVSMSNKYTNRELKSISAFAKRRSDSITESYLKLDSSENITKSVKMIKNVLDYNSEDEEHQNVKKEVSINNNKTTNNLRSNLKRPNTTLALSHNGQISSSRSIHNEVKYQLNDNKYYIIDEQNTHADNLLMLSKPTNDQRFKSLISSMSSFKPRNDQETNKPDILVKKLINSNTALQKQGTTSKELSDTKRTALIEINMKLFEKIVSNIN